MHSGYALEANGLRRMVSVRNDRVETNAFTQGINRRITSSMAEHLQVQRDIWLSSKTLPDDASNSAVHGFKLRDSAVNTVVLLVACGVSLCSCFHLVDSVSAQDSGQWKSPLRVGYVIVPFSTGLAGASALYLHARRYATALDPGEVIRGAIASTSRLLYSIFPASILAGWATSSTHSMMLFDIFQVVLLGVAVLLPVHLVQTRRDDG